MNENETIPMLEQVVSQADAQVQEQRRRSQAMLKQRASASRFKEVLTGVLLVVALGSLAVQFPRFSEPYRWPDPNTNPSVAEADMDAIAAVIESYRISRGAYPASLDEVRFPDRLRDLIEAGNLRYQPRNASFVLDWTLQRWHAVYDGDTGQVKVERVNGS
ncbi:MAG: hypothetical protein ACOYNZ_07815 [Rhodoferax sp.]